MKIRLNEMRYKAKLNKLGHKTLANGNTIPVNEKLFDFRFGYYRVNLVTSIQANVLDQFTNTTTIFARHSDSFVNDGQHSVTINNVTYNIKDIEPDYDINACDVLVLKKVGV